MICNPANCPHAPALARIEEKLNAMHSDVSELKESVDHLNRVIHIGNGTPALVQRVASLEQDRTTSQGAATTRAALVAGIVAAVVGAVATKVFGA